MIIIRKLSLSHSLLLFFALLVSIVLPPQQLKASELSEPSLTSIDDKATINNEILDKRTEYSKQFQMSNGLKKLTVSSTPLHYKDEKGNYTDINTSLVEESKLPTSYNSYSNEISLKVHSLKNENRKTMMSKGDRFIAPQVPFYLEINKNISAGYTIGKDKNKLSFIPADASPVTGTVYSHQRDQIYYENVWQDSDLLLKVLPNGLKEDIIMKTKDAPKKYSFKIEGGVAKDLTSGRMSITPAFLIDAKGEKREVKQTLRLEESTYLDLEVNTTGLDYPITIDPTVNIDGGIYTPYTSNKAYVDFPDLDVNHIVQIDVESFILDQYDQSVLYSPVQIYLTKEEYGDLQNFGPNSPPPGEDEKNVLFIGATRDGNLTVFGKDIRNKLPEGGKIYGAAAYSPLIYSRTAGILYDITYDESLGNELPAPPMNLEIVQKTSTSVYFRWQPSKEQTRVIAYEVYKDSALIGSVTNNTYHVINLAPNSQYSFDIRARDEKGKLSGPLSTQVNTGSATSPMQPTNVKLLSKSETTLNISWDASKMDSDVVGYEIYADSVFRGKTSKIENSFSIKNLASGRPYKIVVKSIDGNGRLSEESPVLIAYTDVDNLPPSRPSNATLSNMTGKSFDIAWTPSTDNVGIDYYEIKLFKGTFDRSPLVQHVKTKNTNYTLTNLEISADGVDYILSIAAYDYAGNPSEANVQGFQNYDAVAPTAPTDLKVTGTTETTLGLSWGASYDAVGVSEYLIYDDQQVIGRSTTANYSVTELSKKVYKLSVRARDAKGNMSEASNTLLFDNEPPTTPTELKVTGKTETTISLSWVASTDKVGVIGYDIYNGANWVGSSITNNYVVTNLNELTPYQFIVRARDAAGNISEPSNIVKGIIGIKGTLNYHYKSNGQLEYITLQSGLKIWFDYDSNGNLLRIRY